MIETITSPEFVAKMRQAREEAEKDGGYEAIAKILSLEGLRAAGAKIPEDFRLTSRIFEDKVSGQRFEISPINDPDGPLQPYDPLGWGACAGGEPLPSVAAVAFQPNRWVVAAYHPLKNL
ncbi:hypothetical protein N9X46_08080 [Paracoccaceae bacterium]|nr:hypothetical protein [Paracoccaceae bacterium]MDB3921375.1 hypothetical protein [Paracoccaceae bacterium]MED7679180.1 hypothetical protein [Rhodobacteraceae bacterium IMCC15231]